MKSRRIFALVVLVALALPCAALAEQVSYISPQCPRTPAGMEYFARGADFHFGRNGTPYSVSRAELCYEKALRLGDSAAAINLGDLYQGQRMNRYDTLYRHSFAVRAFEQAVAMGCPDGYLALAGAYSMGFSPLDDAAKSLKYLQLAAERGSITGKGTYGKRLCGEGRDEKDDAKRARGLALMEESLREGNGHVAPDLAMEYRILGRAEDMIEALRQGCRLGSKESLSHLGDVYAGDWFYKQPRDEEYMRRIMTLRDSIQDKDPIKPISDFDTIIPPRPVVPVEKRGGR